MTLEEQFPDISDGRHRWLEWKATNKLSYRWNKCACGFHSNEEKDLKAYRKALHGSDGPPLSSAKSPVDQIIANMTPDEQRSLLTKLKEGN